MPIGKSKRFDVFTRDQFTCQYCGQQPPSVVLEVDHIHPQSKGGSDDDMNLITACASCNRGKSAKVLSQLAPKPDANLEMLRVNQETGEANLYLKAKKRRDAALNQVCDALRETWASVLTKCVPHDRVLLPWIKRYGANEVEYAIKVSAAFYMQKRWWDDEKIFNALLPYIGAVLRNRSDEEKA